MIGLRHTILPESQRRSLEELSEDLELKTGDHQSKRSAYWTMLLLSAVIASAGLINDSTATVIGAMIIAPLSTPIMGLALSAVKGRRNGSLAFVALGSTSVIVIGMAFALILPATYDLSANTQISSRTAPGFLDLIAALATGLAGAVALARKDVAAILPGVAIAISLVPPLAVTGICFGQGDVGSGLGALLLFLSNLLALVLAGMFVFAVLGYANQIFENSTRGSARARLVAATLFVAVAIPLIAHSVFSYFLNRWESQAEHTATEWVSTVPGSSVTDVSFGDGGLVVSVSAPGGTPDTSILVSNLHGEIPSGIRVIVVFTNGQTIDAGEVP